MPKKGGSKRKKKAKKTEVVEKGYDAIDDYIEGDDDPLADFDESDEDDEDLINNEVMPLDDEFLEEKDEEDSKDQLDPKWGKKKRIYYNTDYIDSEVISSESEAEEEEQEVILLQKKKISQLNPEDYIDTFTNILHQPPQKKEKSTHISKTDKFVLADIHQNLKKLEGKVDVEEVRKDSSILTVKQKLDILGNEKPEIFKLVAIFREMIYEAVDLEPIMKRVKEISRSKKISTPAIEFLKLKYSILLFCAMNVNYYLLRISHGNQVKDHAVIGQLLRVRELYSKLNSLDDKSELDQIIQYFKAKNEGEGINEENDNEDEVDEIDNEENDNEDEVDEIDNEENKVEENEIPHIQSQQEIIDARAEIDEYNALMNSVKNDNNQKINIKRKRSLKNILDNLDQKEKEESKRRKLEEETKAKIIKNKDIDNEDDYEDEDGKDDSKITEEEALKILNQALEKQKLKKQLKEEKKKEIEEQKTKLPIYDEENNEVDETGKRKITKVMEKNLSLRKKSRKELKNPRVKHKVKYKKAMTRRAGQVQRMRDKTKKYHGEVTGIKTKVVKSVPL